MKKLLAVLLALLLPAPALAQSSKVSLDSEIITNWPDNTSGAITPALLRSTVTDIVASYVDWLTCTVQGGIIYWNSTATPTCLTAGTNGQFLKTQGAGANPLWATPSLPAADLTIASNNVVVGNKAGANQPAQELTPSGVLDILGSTNGQLLQRSGGAWAGTVTPALGAATATSINGNTFTTGTYTLTGTAGKTLNFTNSLTLSGTDSTTMTFPSASATVAQKVASGTKALATGAIASAACTAAQTSSATGTLTTDIIAATFNGDPTAVTGYVPLTTGMLTIIVYPTADTVNFKVCNNTSASITPGAITLNWWVGR